MILQGFGAAIVFALFSWWLGRWSRWLHYGFIVLAILAIAGTSPALWLAHKSNVGLNAAVSAIDTLIHS